MHSSMPVELPYNLSEDELVLDPATLRDPFNRDWWVHFTWLVTTKEDDEEIERTRRSVVLLKTKHPEYTLDQCMDTAIIWERG